MPITAAQIGDTLFKKFITGKSQTNPELAYFEESLSSNSIIFSNFVRLDSVPITNPIESSPIGTVWPNSTTPIIKKIQRTLTRIGVTNSFRDTDTLNPDHFSNIISFSYGTGYNYLTSISTNAGRLLNLGAGDFYVDPDSGILIFFSGIPPGVTHVTITAWKYVGKTLNQLNITGGGLPFYTPTVNTGQRSIKIDAFSIANPTSSTTSFHNFNISSLVKSNDSNKKDFVQFISLINHSDNTGNSDKFKILFDLQSDFKILFDRISGNRTILLQLNEENYYKNYHDNTSNTWITHIKTGSFKLDISGSAPTTGDILVLGSDGYLRYAKPPSPPVSNLQNVLNEGNTAEENNLILYTDDTLESYIELNVTGNIIAGIIYPPFPPFIKLQQDSQNKTVYNVHSINSNFTDGKTYQIIIPSPPNESDSTTITFPIIHGASVSKTVGVSINGQNYSNSGDYQLTIQSYGSPITPANSLGQSVWNINNFITNIELNGRLVNKNATTGVYTTNIDLKINDTRSLPFLYLDSTNSYQWNINLRYSELQAAQSTQVGSVIDFNFEYQERTTLAGSPTAINITSFTNVALGKTVRLEINSLNVDDTLTFTITGATIYHTGFVFAAGVINEIFITCIGTNKYRITINPLV